MMTVLKTKPVVSTAQSTAQLAVAPAVVLGKWVAGTVYGPDVFLDPVLPPPCFMPIRLKEEKSVVRPGGKATLRIAITNLGAETHTFSTKANAAEVAVAPANFVLGPLERGEVVLTLAIPAGTESGHFRPIVVTVDGCWSYQLRWDVKVKKVPAHVPNPFASAKPIEIAEMPDYTHHWYDHFYCACPS